MIESAWQRLNVPKYRIKYRQVHSNKLLSCAGSPSYRPGSVQYITCRKYKTAKGCLRQGDEDVNKRIKEKNIYIETVTENTSFQKRSPEYRFLKTSAFGFSCTFGPTKTEVFEYDDVVHHKRSFNYSTSLYHSITHAQ